MIKSKLSFRFFFFFLLYIFSFSILSADEISFAAKKMTGITGTKSDSVSLKGNAQLETDAITITADAITLQDENYRYVIAEGNVICKDTQTGMDFTCEKVTYDRTKKTVLLQTNVKLTDTKNEVTAEAERINYDQNSQVAILQIAVTLKQKNNTCTGAYAIYYKQTQILQLDGNPKIVQDEDSFSAQQIKLDMNSQEITLTGNVNGTVTTSAKAEEPKPREETGEKPHEQ